MLAGAFYFLVFLVWDLFAIVHLFSHHPSHFGSPRSILPPSSLVPSILSSHSRDSQRDLDTEQEAEQ